MKQIEVKYTYGDGKTEQRVRLYADEGKMVTKDGIELWGSVDVLPEDVSDWREVDAPDEPEEDEPNE